MSRKQKMSGYPDPSLTLHPAALDTLDLAGKAAIVVGGTDGLGRAIARQLAARGAEVTVVGRSERDAGVPGIRFHRADLSSMPAAAAVGDALPAHAELIVLTTGIMASTTREVTAEGLERDMAISYFSRLMVLRTLLPRLTAPRPRVFVMGFPGAENLGDPTDLNAERSYSAFPAHMNTVAGNEALVVELARRHQKIGFYGLNPGLVKTNIRANYLGEGSWTHRIAETVLGWFTPTPERFAATLVPVLVAPELDARTAVMFGPKGNPILASEGMTPEYARGFIEATEALLARF
jgi:NAD(P)-dependent dehydrogenase (short-subunit alcohol dehydrogenase family)